MGAEMEERDNGIPLHLVSPPADLLLFCRAEDRAEAAAWLSAFVSQCRRAGYPLTAYLHDDTRFCHRGRPATDALLQLAVQRWFYVTPAMPEDVMAGAHTHECVMRSLLEKEAPLVPVFTQRLGLYTRLPAAFRIYQGARHTDRKLTAKTLAVLRTRTHREALEEIRQWQRRALEDRLQAETP